MANKNEKAITNIKREIEKINKKENRIYFFVIDTQGVPSGSLEYIYNLALILKEDGYNVSMLYSQGEDEFVGVGSWLGEEYSSLPHYDVNKGEIEASPSDILFIPEIFAQVMSQTKKMPCLRVAIMQNFNFMVEQMPYAAQWGDFGIMNAIVNSKSQEELLKDVFPYVNVHKVTPFISPIFGNVSQPKKMVVNLIAKNPEDVHRIIKPFYWKYPLLKWVSFKEIRNLKKEDFAKELRENAITVVCDDAGSFCYSALEAAKSGSIVLCKLGNNVPDWAETEEGLRNCCIWFDDFKMLHNQIATVVRSYITDKVPDTLEKEANIAVEDYNKDRTTTELLTFIDGILGKRKTEMEELLKLVDKEEK